MTMTLDGFAARALLIDACTVAIEPEASLMVTTVSPVRCSINEKFGEVYSSRDTPWPPSALVREKIRAATRLRQVNMRSRRSILLVIGEGYHKARKKALSV